MESPKATGIIIFDEYSVVRIRTQNLFQGVDIDVYGATNELELLNLMSREELNIGLIIMDIGYDTNNGFEILSRIKEKRYMVPVLILTSNNKRKTFLRGIEEGASDYILKPFEDAYLFGKVLQLLDKKKQKTAIQKSSNNEIVFDIHSYLSMELNKARKGKYEITIFMISFFIPEEEASEQKEKRYIKVSDLFYEKFKSILWNTDILERYGTQTFVGVFPFCRVEDSSKIYKKIGDSFDELKEENTQVTSFQLAVSSITYPSEEEDEKALLLSLGLRIEKEIINYKN